MLSLTELILLAVSLRLRVTQSTASTRERPVTKHEMFAANPAAALLQSWACH
jgi:hypothetical protein